MGEISSKMSEINSKVLRLVRSVEKDFIAAHLPSSRAGGVCSLAKVGNGGDHPVVDLGKGQSALSRTLDRLNIGVKLALMIF